MTEEAKPAPTPATDERIAAARFALDCPVSGNDWAWRPEFVRSLIARIDAERAARLAAEARVRVLEEAIDKFIDATRQECCGRGVGYGEAPECCGQPDLLVDCQALDDLCNSRAALKEPANG